MQLVFSSEQLINPIIQVSFVKIRVWSCWFQLGPNSSDLLGPNTSYLLGPNTSYTA